MSVSLWSYREGICDGGGCVGDCDLCNLPYIMEDENDEKIEVKNLPRQHEKYVVARKISKIGGDGEYWFYGSFDNEAQAYGAAEDICGQVFRREKKYE